MKRKMPTFASDAEAEEFVAGADLTDYDLSGGRPMQFEFQPKTERVNMRMPRPLLMALRARAAREGVPYQRVIRRILEGAVQSTKR